MDTIELNELLDKQFGNSFSFHPEFYKEFVELTQKSGEEKRLVKEFVNKLATILSLNDINCGLPWLEKLKKYDNMYSLHLKANSKNYRLLFSKTNDGKLFLRMFCERSGKKATSYKKNVEIAMQRRNTL